MPCLFDRLEQTARLSLHLAALVRSWFAVSPEPMNLVLRTGSPAKTAEDSPAWLIASSCRAVWVAAEARGLWGRDQCTLGETRHWSRRLRTQESG